MRWIAVEDIQPGMVLARPACSGVTGAKLLNQGVVLWEEHLERLRRHRISTVYVEEWGQGFRVRDRLRLNAARVVYSEARQSLESMFRQALIGQPIEISRLKLQAQKLLLHLRHQRDALLHLVQLGEKDDYSAVHSLNVAIYSLILGLEEDLSQGELMRLGMGALLHDLGKLDVPQEVLTKPGRLTAEEFSIVQQHPEWGYTRLEYSGTFDHDVSSIVKEHHERLDGSGYPHGIRNDQVHQMACYVAVADIYDAVTSNRCYRTRLLPHEAMEILMAEAAVGRLDINVVNSFLQKVALYPTGTLVMLNTGQLARVVDFPLRVPMRPVVELVGTQSRKQYLDLSAQLTVFISDLVRA